jgi:hypothetical protein
MAMKNKLIPIVIILLFSGIIRSYSQDSCKVLKPEISGKYIGDCKMGLANGKGIAVGINKYEGRFKNGLPSGFGIYTWANGDTYNGYWRNGMKQGEGTYKFKKNGIDSVLTGIWENDQFSRKINPTPYKISIVRDFDKYSITKIRDGNKVSLKLQQMGMQNVNVSDFTFFADNGSYQAIGNTYVYSQVNFPVLIKINYTTKNKLKTSDLYPVLEVTINEPGEWEIVLTN